VTTCGSPALVMGPTSVYFSFLFKWGAALAAPVSFHFEWGQCLLPPFLFILKGAVLVAPIPSHFKGGSTHCPHFFSFQMEAACIPHTTPIPFHFKQRRCESHMLALFLFLYSPSLGVFHFLFPLFYSN